MIGLTKISVVGALISAVLGFSAGIGSGAAITWKYSSNHYNAKIADLKATHADEKAAAATQALKKLEAAQARGDELFTRLAQTESTLNKKNLELSNALKKTTTGSTCLNAASVRLLNATDRVPEAVSEPAAADGAIATDTDVAWWIGNAKTKYDTCRARLHALIDFEEGE